MAGVPDEESPYRGVLREVLEAAGAEAIRRFRRAEGERKSDGTEVTEADRACEEIIVEGLARHFPGCGVAGEEGAHVDGLDGTWFVDPIDGTSAYLQELAHWGPTVCLVRDGQLVAGAFYMPRLGEYWFAERGGGAWRDDVRLGAVNPTSVGTNDAFFVPSRFHRVTPFPWPGKLRALGSSAAHLAMVAGGGGLATVIGKYSLWDVGCGALLVEESGRSILGLDGNPIDLVTAQGLPFLAGAPTALRYLLAQLRDSPLRDQLPRTVVP